MKNVLLLLTVFLTVNLNAAVIKDTASVFFDTDKHDLQNEGMEALASVLDNIPIDADASWVIHGHTDNRGSLDYNHSLSRRRATEVRTYLISAGVDSSLIHMDYYGETLPVAPNTAMSNLKQNRRVELSVQWYQFETLEEMEAEWRSGSETFQIKPDRDTIISGRQGTRILIESNAFVDSQGRPITESVNFQLTEALSMESFILNGLATMSGDHMLESGGMLKMEALTASGQQVFIDPEMPLSVRVPTDSVRPGMQLFASDDGGSWSKEGQKIGDSLKVRIRPYPSYVIPKYLMPTYKPDLSTKPRRPRTPSYVKEPNEPRQESYVPKEKWFSKLTEKEKRSYFMKEYNQAYQEYLIDMEHYERGIQSYKRDSVQYEKNKLYYKHDLAMWNQKIDKEKLEYKKSEEYLAAIAERDSIIKDVSRDYQEELRIWRVERDKLKQEAFEKMVALGYGNQSLLDQYALSVNTLSWINIDRFYKQDMNNAIQVTVKDKDDIPERVLIVFKELNCVLPMRKADSYYTQGKIPPTANGEIFAYRIRKGKPEMYNERISPNGEMDLKFTQCKFSDIKSKLEEFNKEAQTAS
jgi:hypothetical protein